MTWKIFKFLTIASFSKFYLAKKAIPMYTPHPSYSLYKVTLAHLHQERVYVPFPWTRWIFISASTTECGGNDAAWLLRLDQNRWFGLHLTPALSRDVYPGNHTTNMWGVNIHTWPFHYVCHGTAMRVYSDQYPQLSTEPVSTPKTVGKLVLVIPSAFKLSSWEPTHCEA